MSTRATIGYTEKLHLFDELMNDTVYLEYAQDDMEILIPIAKSKDFSSVDRKALKNMFDKIREKEKKDK